MKTIEIDEELYQYIASRTLAIGESASDILRRLLRLPASPQPFVLVQENMKKPEGENHIEKMAHQAVKNAEITASKPQSSKQMEQRVERLITSDAFKQQTKAVSRFLMLLGLLYQANPKAFSNAAKNIHGNERRYFALDEKSILENGSGVKAKPVPDSPYWVITNNNTERKGLILTSVMQEMGLPEALIERVRLLFI